MRKILLFVCLFSLSSSGFAMMEYILDVDGSQAGAIVYTGTYSGSFELDDRTYEKYSSVFGYTVSFGAYRFWGLYQSGSTASVYTMKPPSLASWVYAGTQESYTWETMPASRKTQFEAWMGAADTDGDGVSDWAEYQSGEDPWAGDPLPEPSPDGDTDGDWFPDWVEILHGTDWNDATVFPSGGDVYSQVILGPTDHIIGRYLKLLLPVGYIDDLTGVITYTDDLTATWERAYISRSDLDDLYVIEHFSWQERLDLAGGKTYWSKGSRMSLLDSSTTDTIYYNDLKSLDSDNDGVSDIDEINVGTDPYVPSGPVDPVVPEVTDPAPDPSTDIYTDPATEPDSRPDTDPDVINVGLYDRDTSRTEPTDIDLSGMDPDPAVLTREDVAAAMQQAIQSTKGSVADAVESGVFRGTSGLTDQVAKGVQVALESSQDSIAKAVEGGVYKGISGMDDLVASGMHKSLPGIENAVGKGLEKVLSNVGEGPSSVSLSLGSYDIQKKRISSIGEKFNGSSILGDLTPTSQTAYQFDFVLPGAFDIAGHRTEIFSGGADYTFTLSSMPDLSTPLGVKVNLIRLIFRSFCMIVMLWVFSRSVMRRLFKVT